MTIYNNSNRWKHDSCDSVDESRDCSLTNSGGIAVINEDVAISGDGATTINLFSFEGCIDLMEIGLLIKTVTDATTFSNVKFVVYDGTNTVDLTDVVDGSGIVTGAKFFKTGAAGTALSLMNGGQVRILESAFNKPFVETVINGLPGTTNYVQLSFTGDANTDITANVKVRWKPLCNNGTLSKV